MSSPNPPEKTPHCKEPSKPLGVVVGSRDLLVAVLSFTVTRLVRITITINCKLQSRPQSYQPSQHKLFATPIHSQGLRHWIYQSGLT
jgi:hypothetical protein